MPTFDVYLQSIASTCIRVEANDKDEAADLAYEKGMPTICAQCSGWGNPPGVEMSDVWEIQDYDKDIIEVTDE